MTQIHKAEGSAAGLFELGKTLPREAISDVKQYESRSNFVLDSMAVAELGGTKENSALMCLYDTEDAFDDEVRLVGKSLRELEKGAVSFGVLIQFSGAGLNDELFYILQQNIKRLLKVKGVMVKGADTEIWARVSQQAMSDGLTFEKWGSVFLTRLHGEFPEVQFCRLLFIVDSQKEFDELHSITTKRAAELEALKAQVWESRGYNFKDCHVLGHCGQCSDKKLCANIRKMERIVKVTRQKQQEEEK